MRNWSDRQRSHGSLRRDRDIRTDNTELRTVIGMVHSVIMRWLDSLGERSDQRDRRRSFQAPILRGGRDEITYYMNGRKTEVPAEINLDTRGRDLYMPDDLLWDDGRLLTEAERRDVLAAVCSFLERKRIPWRLEPVG